MTCTNSSEQSTWTKKSNISPVEWQKLLSKLAKKEIDKRLLSTSNRHHRTPSRQYSSTKKDQDRVFKNQFYDDSFTSSLLFSPSSISISRHDLSKPDTSSSTKTYISSLRSLAHPTSSKQPQPFNQLNNNVVILKFSREDVRDHTDNSSSHSTKKRSSSPTTTTSTASLIPPTKQSFPSLSSRRSSTTAKSDRLKRYATHYDFSVNVSSNISLTSPLNSTINMAMSTTSHPSSNPSLFAYGNTVAGGTTVRQRALAETTTNSLLITTERLKPNTSSSMRPARQSSTVTTTMPSTYTPPQLPQRNVSQTTKSRAQQEKSTNSKDLYEYPDPFTNCPQDILNKLAQLTKLQLETVDWEKKRRFSKKKIISNGTTQGKDSP